LKYGLENFAWSPTVDSNRLMNISSYCRLSATARQSLDTRWSFPSHP